MRAFASASLILVGLTACRFAPENFDQTLGSDFCRRYEECSKGDFDREYDDIDDCVQDYVSASEDTTDCFLDKMEDGDCTYDADEAKECHEAILSADCDDFTEGDWTDDCDNYWSCDEDWDVVECWSEGF